MSTLHNTLAAARERLVVSGIAPDEAAIDVDLFARTILGWDRAHLLTELNRPPPSDLDPRFTEWVARREQREPSPYIVGIREFWGLEFRVTPAVLIPRPETELIVEETISLLHDGPSARIGEIGTGSGCISVALAYELARVRVTATDISGEALDIARENATRHGVADRIRFVHTSYLNDVPEPFHVIVANPPYVKDSDAGALSRQVAGYEPHVALFGGTDGMRNITGVLDAARRKLVKGGWLVFEFGLGQEDEIRKLIARYQNFHLEHLRADLQGIARTAVVRRG